MKKNKISLHFFWKKREWNNVDRWHQHGNVLVGALVLNNFLANHVQSNFNLATNVCNGFHDFFMFKFLNLPPNLTISIHETSNDIRRVNRCSILILLFFHRVDRINTFSTHHPILVPTKRFRRGGRR